jgi:hypothetical protein
MYTQMMNALKNYFGLRFVTQFQHQTADPLLKLLLQPQSHNPEFLRRLRLLISVYIFNNVSSPNVPESYPRHFFSARRFHRGRAFMRTANGKQPQFTRPNFWKSRAES